MGFFGQFFGYLIFFTCALVAIHLTQKSAGSVEPQPWRERFPVAVKQVIWGGLMGLAIGLAFAITLALAVAFFNFFPLGTLALVVFLIALLCVVALFFFAREWVREWLFLMDLDDDHLPGRFDKPIWAVLMVALPPVGVWLFRAYRLNRWPEVAVKPALIAEIS